MGSNAEHCRVESCASQEEITRLLMKVEYTRLIEEYRSILGDDPSYLEFHGASVVLIVEYALKLHDLDTVPIGLCDRSCSGNCCVLSALVSAIQRHGEGIPRA